jgi:hypothetical protein
VGQAAGRRTRRKQREKRPKSLTVGIVRPAIQAEDIEYIQEIVSQQKENSNGQLSPGEESEPEGRTPPVESFGDRHLHAPQRANHTAKLEPLDFDFRLIRLGSLVNPPRGKLL